MTGVREAMKGHLKRYQKESDVSYAEGVFATLELLDAKPDAVERVLLSSYGEPNEGVAKIRTLCAERCIPLAVDDRTIERISPRASHLAIGIFRKYPMSLDANEDHVVLIEPADMGNLGAIARTMVGFGVRDLALVRPAVDAFDPKAVRASMGALFRLSLVYFDSFDEYRQRFSRPAFAFMTDGRKAIHQTRFESPCALVFGNESSGLPPTFHDLGTSVAIPQTAAVDSLSLPTAVAIALYERAGRAGRIAPPDAHSLRSVCSVDTILA
jgi:TrmH family RNA methyltransferase